MTGLAARTAAVVAAAGIALLAGGTAFADEPSPPGSPGAPPSATGPAPGQPPQEAGRTERAAAQVRPAIVYLQETFAGYVADQDGDYFNGGSAYQLAVSCTGFGVNPQGYIATAGHCVDTTSAEGLRAEFVRLAALDVQALDPSLPLQTIIDYGTANWVVEGTAKGSPVDSQITAVVGAGTGGSTAGEALPARVVDFRPHSQGDVALLKIESTDLPSVLLDKAADVPVGTPVLSVGYPAAADAVTDVTLEPSNKDGQVSTRRTIGTVPFYETSASLSGGMSGGPTVDLDGDVVGINSATLRGDQAFNFIAPSTGLTELLARNGVQNQLGPNDTLYRSSLDAYYGGRHSEAIAGFERLLLVDPQHQQALQYKTLAAKAKEQFGDAPAPAPAADPAAGIAPWLLWTLIGAGAAIVLAGLTTALVIMRSKRRAEVPALPAGPNDRPYFGYGATPATPAGPGGICQPGPGFADAPTTIVTPAEIVATQRPAPRESAPNGLARDGAPIQEQPAPTVGTLPADATSRTCPACASTLPPTAAFCPTCGTRQDPQH